MPATPAILPDHQLPDSDPISVAAGPDGNLWRSDDQGDGERMPDTLGGVRIAHLVGEGGMGRVYLGRHPVLDVDVAVKVMDVSSGDRARFLTEARLAAKVQHENVVRVLNAGDERGHRFIVMEFVSGSSLKHLVAERGRLPWRQAATYILQAAQGLAAAHRLGIVHRDIKPSNLLLDAQDRVKVSDLGVARTLLGESDSTATGSVIGTPAYMAPEQARDPHNVTPAADIYALGASFYMLVVGQVPFPGLTFAELITAHRTIGAPDPRRLAPELPAEAAELIQRFMSREAWSRPADGAEAVAALERLLGLATVSTAAPRPVAAVASARRWLLPAAAASIAVGALLLVGWALPGGQGGGSAPAASQPERHPPAPVAVAAAPPAVPAVPAWQTPPRAVFVVADHLPAAALAGADAAVAASGLPVVERQRLDAIVREQDLLAAGRIDAATAGRLGRLVGGHIAVFAGAVEDRVEVRAVLVETGELAACRLVAPEQTGDAVGAAIAAAAALLPVQAVARPAGDGLRVSAGARHGLHAGDRLELRRAADGPVLATAVVTAATGIEASCAVQGAAAADLGGALATRIAP